MRVKLNVEALRLHSHGNAKPSTYWTWLKRGTGESHAVLSWCAYHKIDPKTVIVDASHRKDRVEYRINVADWLAKRSLSPKSAAEKLSVTEQAVYNWIRRGKMGAKARSRMGEV
jgi:hypothetical protein